MTLRQTIYISALFLTGQALYGQTNQGYIDYEKVVVALPRYANGQKILEARAKLFNDSLTIFMHKFQRFLQTEIPHNVKMDSASRAELEDTIEKFQKKIEDYQRYAKNELNQTQKAIEINLKNIAFEELKIYCAYKNIACIVDHKSILYCASCIDFTDEFAEYLKNKLE